jgi:putative solute:sodium symporter small subunit
MAVPSSKTNRGRTGKLLLQYLAGWLLFGLALHLFFAPLNQIRVPLFGFPLGLYLAMQGALIAFIVLLFMFAKRRDEREKHADGADEGGIRSG